ncbi:A/G-specific adenine glycosylase [Teredinibacter turnerae]|uniref:A/G-specific adenine glycosylase n=1 Tax=Teredinibacter turnerae TaxID=2426 RepID=UPI0003795059|nr:A/G-specific adenine glycosylase [Teredinibacter turnerae]
MSSFADRLLAWFDDHGRKNLPWQHPITPYRVWLSEIMLQQTQVETVIPYFERFVAKFNGFASLAEAPLDEVLHLWTGLGYYARARNLHRCAQQVVAQHGGDMPSDMAELEQLPGIGRSTAAAIASIAFEQPCAILDGNVKRVLARYHAVEGWPGKAAVHDALWQFAEKHMPRERCRDYTQAIMDLGATLCTRASPQCEICPMRRGCKAKKTGQPQNFPGKKPRKILPVKTVQMLIMRNPQGQVLLLQRPPTGIWGGLWSFPEIETGTDCESHIAAQFGRVQHLTRWPVMRHTFSHYHLDIAPVVADLLPRPQNVAEADARVWYNLKNPPALGLAAPVKKLLTLLDEFTLEAQ